ncbi:MAG: prolipoprotein diacylglyceryl transferase family protein [Pirellulaceae bacterium]
MKQTLFFVGGEDVLGLPVFGFGWLLIAWAIFSIGLLAWLVRRRGFDAETRSYLPVLLVIGVVIVYLLPQLEVVDPDGNPLGLAIRGYGVLLLAGVVSGVSVTMVLARRVGMDTEEVYTIAFWMFLFGIAGARLFFVIQEWSSFQKPTILATLVEMLKFTEGGLVVFGSVIGALIAFVVVTGKRRLPMLKLADVIAPGMVLGLAIGRFGCLLNGCCYGGVAPENPCAIRFPKYTSVQQRIYSPPFRDQLMSGRLHGIRLEASASGPVVARVEPDSAASATGLQPGQKIKAVNHRLVKTMRDVRYLFDRTGADIVLTSQDDRDFNWTIDELPTQSLPVHPTQIYSSLNAALIFFLLWAFFPFRTRDGQVFALLMTLYPVSRFMLEIIRDDEHGRFGTALTISQLISLVSLAGVALLWCYIARRPNAIGVRS